jgi:hypothetical protein
MLLLLGKSMVTRIAGQCQGRAAWSMQQRWVTSTQEPLDSIQQPHDASEESASTKELLQGPAGELRRPKGRLRALSDVLRDSEGQQGATDNQEQEQWAVHAAVGPHTASPQQIATPAKALSPGDRLFNQRYGYAALGVREGSRAPGKSTATR